MSRQKEVRVKREEIKVLSVWMRLIYCVYRITVGVRFGPSESIGGIVEVLGLAKAEEPLFVLHSAATSVFFLASCHYNVHCVMCIRIVATAPASFVMSVPIISAAPTGRIRVKFHTGSFH